jgi:hypothetical protein
MIKWIKKWYLRKLEEKYNNKTIVIPEADIKYPPPSAYEIKQIKTEYRLDSRSMK